jgi:Tfp pilus assembly pilus retraction ATPase PilT
MSPSSEEALYSALRKIPDVYLIPDTQDAAGRTTVAVAKRSGNTAYAVLFDPETGSYRETCPSSRKKVSVSRQGPY